MSVSSFAVGTGSNRLKALSWQSTEKEKFHSVPRSVISLIYYFGISGVIIYVHFELNYILTCRSSLPPRYVHNVIFINSCLKVVWIMSIVQLKWYHWMLLAFYLCIHCILIGVMFVVLRKWKWVNVNVGINALSRLGGKLYKSCS